MGWDVFNRVKNMVYTTSDNYGVKVKMSGGESATDTERVTVATADSFTKMGLTEDEAMSLVMHSAAHEGAHVKYSDIKPLRAFMKTARKEGADLAKLSPMIQIAEDYRVDYKTSVERPGYLTSRREHAKAASKLFKDRPSGNADADFAKAVSFFTNDVDLRKHGWKEDALDWDEAKNTARELENIASQSDTSSEMLNSVYDYYKTKYELEDPPEEGGSEGEDGEGDGDESDDDDKSPTESKKSKRGGKESKSGGKSSSTGGDSTPEDSEEDSDDGEDKEDNPEDDENTSEEDSEEDADTSKDDSELDKAIEELEKALAGKDSDDLLGEKAEKELEERKERARLDHKKLDYYEEESEKKYTRRTETDKEFKSLWSREEHARVVKELCVGVHAGADILYGIRLKHRSESVNCDRLKQLDGQARRMGNALLQVLKADTNDRGCISTSGSKIIANKIWKPIHTGDSNVFFHKDFTEVGGYVIDLVLDASGSQCGRNSDIAKQAYIIAEACSIAGIPCRVTQFRNPDTFTLLECLRDFDDDRKANLNCRYFCGDDDNRDGLAIQMADVELQKRKEPNKIMLVLSDGAPCDQSGSTKINAFGGMGYYVYDSERLDNAATRDVYNVVRKIRKSGTALMAIYVGSSGKCLEIEKIMYGTDFAYIGSDMGNFVDVVMKYLVKHIQGFDK